MLDAAPCHGNRLLAAMPDSTLERWSPHLLEVEVPRGSSILEGGTPLATAWFPTSALVSFMHVLEDGHMVEIAMVGNEGLVGVSIFLGGLSSNRGLVQGAGRMLRLPAAMLLEEFERSGPARQLLLRFTQALIAQMTQVAACNRHHTIDQQLCRWLLLCLDRVGSNEIAVTQELIAGMLGVRREGVTVAAARLQRSGLVRYSRGHITVLDRGGIERCSCECYATVKREYARLLPSTAAPSPAATASPAAK